MCGCESCEDAYPEDDGDGGLECNADCPEGEGETVGCVPTSTELVDATLTARMSFQFPMARMASSAMESVQATMEAGQDVNRPMTIPNVLLPDL